MAAYTDLNRAWYNHQLNWVRTRKQTFLPPIIKPVPIRASSTTPIQLPCDGEYKAADPITKSSAEVESKLPRCGLVAPASSVIASMEDEKGILTVLTDVPATNKRKADEPIPTPAPAEKKAAPEIPMLDSRFSADDVWKAPEQFDRNFGKPNASTPGLGLEEIAVNFPVNGLATYFAAPPVVPMDESDKQEYETDFDEKKN